MKHDADFGIDYMLEIWSEEDEPKLISRDIAIQIKSHSRFPKPNPSTDSLRLPELDLRKELWFERIKSSTINYLVDSNSFITSIYLAENRIDFAFDGFRRILPGSLSQRGNTYSRDEQPLYGICPLRPVRTELLRRANARDYVKIPVHPLNFCRFLPSYREQERGRTKTLNGSRRRGIFDDTQGLSRDSKAIVHADWREVIIDSILSDVFDVIFRIRLAPFLTNNPQEIVSNATKTSFDRDAVEITDMWVLFECLVAGFYFEVTNFGWLHEIVKFRSKFLSLLALRLCRYHTISLPQDLFAAYLQAGSVHPKFDCGLKPFQTDLFGSLSGKTGIREYYNDGCDYLIDLIATNPKEARKQILYVLTSEEQYGVGELFGQMVASRSTSKLPSVVTEIVRTEFKKEWDETPDETLNVIGALNSIGVSCLDFSPGEK
jgi:hypothetical protein